VDERGAELCAGSGGRAAFIEQMDGHVGNRQRRVRELPGTLKIFVDPLEGKRNR
jgi:hypothetical protein